ncbi:hypothetical protein NESM_000833500 [Novymonas esmeraldas]|uniref:Uncharacterized protein n=1 Tax=Novymonas esmeraldas TaxID=1808958 RepID=A0AAW0EYX4_9TRYP
MTPLVPATRSTAARMGRRSSSSSPCHRAISSLLLLGVVVAVAALSALATPAAAAAASTSATAARFPRTTLASPECAGYAAYFPYAQTSRRCPIRDMCVTRTHCCASPSVTDLSTCLDITSFQCDVAAVCANYTSSSSSSSSSLAAAPWYPQTHDFGASLTCCRDVPSTTQAPARPPLDGWSAAADSRSSGDGEELTPAATCAAETATACPVVMQFAPLIRAFCNSAIPATYSDAFLNANAAHLCCEYAAGPGGNRTAAGVGKAACGASLLDLPPTGLYHCAFDLRGSSKVCCNGRIDDDGSGAPAQSNSDDAPRVFTYVSAECLFDPDQQGNGAESPAASRRSLLTVVVMATVAVYACL